MFPLDFWEMSLLIAIIAIILLASSEMLSVYGGKLDILIDKKKLKNVTVGVVITFLVTQVFRIVIMIIVS